MIETTLYKQDVKSTIRVWCIQETVRGYTVYHGVLDGTIQTKSTSIFTGKAGRSAVEQRQSEINSKIEKRLDEGYVNDLALARETKPTNRLGFAKPMLAQPLKNVKLPHSFYVQYKYDGNRCLITRHDGKLIAYTRNGKIIKSIEHILSAAECIKEGDILDGELYCHGMRLQQIRSLIARPQDDSSVLKFVCYDTINRSAYRDRHADIRAYKFKDPIVVADTKLHNASEFNITDALREAMRSGYEGLIIRLPDSFYEDGKRSKGLVKVKQFMDHEFKVVDVKPSKDGWAILVCGLKDGKTFSVSAPGTMEEKMDILYDSDNYIGKFITVEFANLTKDGVPFHPVAIAWRSIDD